VYIVYPLVEESEKVDLKAAIQGAEHLQREIFPQVRVGLLHGRLPTAEKERTMGAFKAGAIQVLVQGRVRGRPVLGIWVGAAPFEGVEALARELAQNPATEPSISCTPPELDRGYPAAADAGPPPFPVVEPSGF
ncbi:MAG: hypothetical protein JNL38_08145, partial [Myxococcales bacterium]|nr:hypothetical protein [Myxococcales bacterium]